MLLPFCARDRSIMATPECKKSKEGYDYEFVSPPPKSLECPVCLLTLRDPHVISCCGNEFCQVCIERVKRDGKPCPLCSEPKFTTFLHKKLVREVNALAVRCPQKELGCDWEGELGQLQSHLSPGAGVVSSKGCGFVMVACTYRCGARLQRRLLQEHQREICPKQPIEMQFTSLTRKFETIAVEFKRVTVENQQLRQELDKVKEVLKKEINQVNLQLEKVKQDNQAELNQLKEELDKVNEIHKQELSQSVHQQLDKMKQDSQLELNQLKLELSKIKKQNQFLQTAQKEQQKICDKLNQGQISVKTDFDRQNALQNSKLDNLEKKCVSLQAYTMPLPVPPFYFSLSNVDHYRTNDLIYCSEPFYSRPGGYKMRMKVYPNGVNDHRGTHVSVYVGILRGEFDDQLCWPFDGSITIEVYNRTTEQWSNEQTIAMNEAICGPKVVGRCLNIMAQGSWGYSNYISLSKLETDFVKATDIIRFRVIKVAV